MRVLHAISGLRATAGGTVRALMGLAQAQRDAGCEISIASTFVFPEEDEIASAREAGFDIHAIGPCRDPMSRSALIRPTLRDIIPDADIVHIHGLWEQIHHEAARAARRACVPYVFSPHGMLDPWSLSQGWFKKRLYLALRLRRDLERASAIHYTTQIERDLAATLRLATPVIVEPVGLDLREFEQLPPRGCLRAKYDISDRQRLILFLSRVHPKKGLEMLIPAAAEAMEADDVLVIAGPDENGYRKVVESWITRFGLSDRVRFTGLLNSRQRIEALTDADLFVLPSFQENFGIVVIEALACGCPVVISDQVNIHPEISAQRVGGVVPLQVEALAVELRRWLGDAHLRQEASSRARDFVRKRYDWQTIAARWIEHYRQLIRKHRREPP